MNILYYIEPWEQLKKGFRFPTLKGVIAPEIRALKEKHPQVNAVVVLGEDVYEEYRNAGMELDAEIAVVKMAELKEIFSDEKEAIHHWFNGTATEEQTRSMAELVKKAAGNFVPDLSIVYESSAPFLRSAYSHAPVFYSMFGAFSRAPFPATGYLGENGLYRQAELVRLTESSFLEEVTGEHLGMLDGFRRKYGGYLIASDPLFHRLAALRSRFGRLLLLPLQVDGYFAFTESCDVPDQEALLRRVLETVDPNTAVLVTFHGDFSNSVSSETLHELEQHYPNLLPLTNEEGIPFISQFLVPHVDGVVTVSSSVGYLAVLMRKPVYVIGESHLTPFSAGGELKAPGDMNAYLDRNDRLLFLTLYLFNHSAKFEIYDGEAWFQVLDTLGKKGLEGLVRQRLDESGYLAKKHQWLMDAGREWQTRQLMAEARTHPKPDPLLEKIMEADAVSFDLFDTLVDRPLIDPHELFLKVQPQVRKMVENAFFPFHKFRREAEAAARRVTEGQTEVTLEEIYQEFAGMTGFSGERCREIMTLELEAEKTLIQPREPMVWYYNTALALGKTVTIISDIYMDEAFIAELLDEKGIGGYHKLYVSANTKTRKHNGTLYPQYLEWLRETRGIPAARCLHVGDNPIADIRHPRSYGMETFQLYRGVEAMEKHKLGQVLRGAYASRHTNTSIVSGLIANKFFADPEPLVSEESLFDGKLYNFGYAAFGPLLLGFTQWLIRRVRFHGYKRVVFLARDGHVLKEAYDALAPLYPELPESRYLYCSRRAATIAALDKTEDLIELYTQDFRPMTLEEFFFNRLGTGLEAIPARILEKHALSPERLVTSARDYKEMSDFLRECAPYVLQATELERKAYFRYLEEEGMFDPDSCLVDIGYSGTMQHLLTRMTGVEYGGFYFLTHHHSLEKFGSSVFEGYLGNYDDHRISYRHELNNFVFLFETALSSYEGSLMRVRLEGERIEKELIEEANEEARVHSLREIHLGAMDLVTDFTNGFGRFAPLFELPPLLAQRIFLSFSNHPNRQDALMFAGIGVENGFGGGDAELIPDYTPFLNKKGMLNEESYHLLMGQSSWKRGAETVYRPLMGKRKRSKAEWKGRGYEPNTKLAKHKIFRSRKLNKLYRDPYLFFYDARSPLFKRMAYLFSNRCFLARVNLAVLRKSLLLFGKKAESEN